MLAMAHVEVMGQGQGMGFGTAWMLRWCSDQAQLSRIGHSGDLWEQGYKQMDVENEVFVCKGVLHQSVSWKRTWGVKVWIGLMQGAQRVLCVDAGRVVLTGPYILAREQEQLVGIGLWIWYSVETQWSLQQQARR